MVVFVLFDVVVKIVIFLFWLNCVKYLVIKWLLKFLKVSVGLWKSFK